jgi:hypothetical protein
MTNSLFAKENFPKARNALHIGVYATAHGAVSLLRAPYVDTKGLPGAAERPPPLSQAFGVVPGRLITYVLVAALSCY